jgi:hypothetical protein
MEETGAKASPVEQLPWYYEWWGQLIIYLIIAGITVVLLIWVPGKIGKTLVFLSGLTATLLTGILLNYFYVTQQPAYQVPEWLRQLANRSKVTGKAGQAERHAGRPIANVGAQGMPESRNNGHYVGSGQQGYNGQQGAAQSTAPNSPGANPASANTSLPKTSAGSQTASSATSPAINAPFVGQAGPGSNAPANTMNGQYDGAYSAFPQHLEDMSVPQQERGHAPPAGGRAMPPDHPLQRRQAAEASTLEPFVQQGPGNLQTPGYQLNARPEDFSSASIDPDLIQDPMIGDGIVPQDARYSKPNVAHSEVISDVRVPPRAREGQAQGNADSYSTYYEHSQDFKDAIKGAEEDFYGRNEVRRAQELNWGLQKQQDPLRNAAQTANGFTQLQNLAAQHTPLRRDPSLLDPPGFVSER